MNTKLNEKNDRIPLYIGTLVRNSRRKERRNEKKKYPVDSNCCVVVYTCLTTKKSMLGHFN